MPDDFEQMWAALAPLGRSAASGGYFRQPFTSVESELRAWFREQCAARGLAVEADGNGNLLAWWGRRRLIAGAGRLPPRLGPRRRGVRRPAGRGLLARRDRPAPRARGGAAPADRGRRLRRGGGVALRDRLPRLAAGHRRDHARRRPASCATGTAYPCSTRWPPPASRRHLGRADWLDRIGCFVELHVEQGRDLVDRDAPVGLATEIWPHGRYRFDFTGDANHAGTTRMEDRHDPMLSFAMTALAAGKQAARDRAAGHLRPRRRGAQRHQRDPLAGDRVARRPLRHRGRRWCGWSPRSSARATSAPTATAPGSR